MCNERSTPMFIPGKWDQNIGVDQKKFWRTTRQVLAGRNNRSSLEMKNAFSSLDTRSIQARRSLLS
ncbi:hypothetical protein K492DRAFT_38247 [Lichtheimia hyalospora FSU 10163]|nr:hypothetical protein K492DRAFT_38247 [Lichtheimia hyalospora FSU 10163]